MEKQSICRGAKFLASYLFVLNSHTRAKRARVEREREMRGNERGCCCYFFFSTIHTHNFGVQLFYLFSMLPTYLPNPRIMVNYIKMKAGGGGVGPPIKKKHGPDQLKL